MEVLPPKGFKKIAVRETNAGILLCEVFYNPLTKKFFIKAGDRSAGPMDFGQLTAMKDALQDVIWMKGRFNYIED